ncbi:cysteine desulfurase NifS [Candidatus Berkelbacteria bacterium CG08_land_8_20_14_0_20_39_8]|uniref:cysteine desulfurase n=1 Tax=Candidatus Berkelbacteria bacterium CG08_land_8_20_14_0_20_39_8 TaxID=1974511 RepID=A0A2M6YBK1_9BACT|nr:MAG: cysteine desulfurase NifS [Candidatus Berkelbacteria bacterium CG08_land_8_20_14_0_20_39_8]
MSNIYLDNSATTSVDTQVLDAMLPYFSNKFGNASSVHSFGQEARAAIDNARYKIAEFLNCKSTEIIFTSGGSESDNLAIKGILEASEIEKPHIITSAFEHHAILETVKELESDEKIEATFIRPNCDGIIEIAEIEKAIKENTILVSVMYVNNEIGTVQPIRAIGQMIEKRNKDRRQKMYFHTDAVQAAEYFDMNVDYLHVDLLTMTAHKIYGPKGVGLLYIRSGVPIKHQIVGGGQEYKKRAGTENVASIVGFGKAVEIIQKSKLKNQNYNSKLESLRDKLIDGLLQISNSFLNGSRKDRSPANANISFINAEGEAILLNLDMEGIAVSTGSACTSGSLEPSHVLISMGLKPEQCHGSIRFTLGRSTTEEEIDKVLEVLPPIIEKLRKMSPFK